MSAFDEDIPTPAPANYNGVWGWLIFPAILNPLASVSLRLHDAGDVLRVANSHAQQAASDPYGVIYIPAAMALLFILICLLWIVGIVLAFRHSGRFPAYYIWLTVIDTAVNVFFVFVAAIFGQVTTQDTAGAIVAVIVAAIWIAYMRKSKRVAVTFGLPFAKEEPTGPALPRPGSVIRPSTVAEEQVATPALAKYNGIWGWLIFPAILNPLFWILVNLTAASGFLGMASRQFQQTASDLRMLGYIPAVAAFIFLVYSLSWVVCIVLAFRHSRYFPSCYIWLAVINAALNVLFVFINSNFGFINLLDLGPPIVSVMVAAIWIAYMRKSKRVAVTFGLPLAQE